MNPDDIKNKPFNLGSCGCRITKSESYISISRYESEWDNLDNLIDIANEILRMHGYKKLAEKLESQKIKSEGVYNITFFREENK